MSVVIDWSSDKVAERVANLSDKSGGDCACWRWLGGVDRKGYGIFYTSARTTTTAHRAAWNCANKRQAGVGDVIDHLCRNRRCVNPLHLEAVTSKENTKRGLLGDLLTHCAKGHPYDAENTGHAKRQDGQPRRFCKACSKAASAALYRRKADARIAEKLKSCT